MSRHPADELTQDAHLSALMARAQAGDKPSYARLLLDCQPLVRRAARRAGARGDLIEDVVQETLITLHNARRTYDPSRSFSGWLAVIARRRAVDLLRRSGRLARREIHEPIAYDQHPDDGADAASGWREASRAHDLREALATLSPSQREAVERLAIDGQSLAEASTTTGKTKGALKVNFHRALAALKQRLSAGTHDDG